MKIAIVGSTGRTGLLCTQQLLHEGHTVHALCRSAAKAYDLFTCVPRALRHQLRVIEVPDFEVGALREAIRGCEAVIFAACGVSFLGLFNRSGGPKYVDYRGVLACIEAIKSLTTLNEDCNESNTNETNCNGCNCNGSNSNDSTNSNSTNSCNPRTNSSNPSTNSNSTNSCNNPKCHPPIKFVLISSLGVTRPYWPIYIMLNTFGGRVMSYKLKGEEALRASGLPRYTIIRPGRLMPDNPANSHLKDSELLVSQGDVITGQLLREDVARVAVHVAVNADAANKCTFELISAASKNIESGHERNVAQAVRSKECSELLFKDLKSDLQVVAERRTRI